MRAMAVLLGVSVAFGAAVSSAPTIADELPAVSARKAVRIAPAPRKRAAPAAIRVAARADLLPGRCLHLGCRGYFLVGVGF